MPPPPPCRALAAGALALLAAACSGSEHEIGPPRTITGEPLRLGMAEHARHGYELAGGARGPHGADPRAGAVSMAGAGGSSFAWDVPPGWQQKPATQFRIGSFAAPGDVDVSVSTAAGGVAQNVDRWRGQMGLGPMAAGALEQLPRRAALGRDDAVLVDLPGRFSGGMGAAPIEDARLLGLVVPGSPAVFVKMLGPRAAVDAQRAAFDAFVQSLRPKAPGEATPPAPQGEGRASGADPHGSDPRGSDPHGASPHGGRPTPAGGTPLPQDAANGRGKLRWQAPEGWQLGNERPPREVTFHPGGDREVEAYVTVMTGDAGGLAANLGMWRSQAGLPPLDAAAAAALPRIRLLGGEAALLEAYGPENAVVGTTARVGNDSAWVKMVGPTAKVRAARDAFVRFCESMETVP